MSNHINQKNIINSQTDNPSLKKQQSYIKKLAIISKQSQFIQSSDIQAKNNKQIHDPISQIQNKYNQNQNNLFKTFSNDNKFNNDSFFKKNQQIQTKNYERQCLQYQRYFFDERIKSIIRRMTIRAYNMYNSYQQHPFHIFPIQKLITIICKKLLLNRFQLLFLQYAFQDTKWKYDNQCIKKNANKFKDYVMLPDSQLSSTDIKYMQIYILYCAYFTKKSLNQFNADNNPYTSFCLQICQKFKQYFAQWQQCTRTGSNKINTKQLNNIFKKLTYHSSNFQQIQNYCLVVQQVIQISPAYNPDKNQKSKKTKKIKKQQNKKKQYSQQQLSQNQMSSQNNNIQNQQYYQHQLAQPPILTKRNSSVMSFQKQEANYYIRKSNL